MRRAALLLVIACANPSVDVEVTRGTSATVAPHSVALLGVKSDRPEMSASAEDGCVAALQKAGLQVASHIKVQAAVDAKGLNEQNAAYYQELGQATGAESIVVGTITAAGDDVTRFTARMYSAADGQVIRSVVAHTKAKDTLDKRVPPYDWGFNGCEKLLSDAAAK